MVNLTSAEIIATAIQGAGPDNVTDALYAIAWSLSGKQCQEFQGSSVADAIRDMASSIDNLAEAIKERPA